MTLQNCLEGSQEHDLRAETVTAKPNAPYPFLF
eukprot:CAMPEP_0202358666 /NCGR_PEP_ID=MMETSP1126-20121109/12259_1 /ASSEMBLY_ACC=CAM_ASM_000457 /TAXON_ID=3047 /ORGANISM="Dunaliella tertiolecta, Strain CCMP1320" /LENGTH=32 /DNA_ID= /DNA_START= /DNA_END= /DNA_ORIENTATION=